MSAKQKRSYPQTLLWHISEKNGGQKLQMSEYPVYHGQKSEPIHDGFIVISMCPCTKQLQRLQSDPSFSLLAGLLVTRFPLKFDSLAICGVQCCISMGVF